MMFILGVVFVGAGLGQERPFEGSLKHTIQWMTKFTAAHGFAVINAKQTTEVRVTGIEGCRIGVAVKFPTSYLKLQPKAETKVVDLKDLDPANVRIRIHQDTYEVDFRSSDGKETIIGELEFVDLPTQRTESAIVYIYLDSENSARRFAAAITHAITLCGGKPAPAGVEPSE
jgi:hypothetical protein